MPESTGSISRNRNATRDGLTSAFNRPHFLSLLADECRFAVDMGKPFSVCLIDVDQLRKFNEQHGITKGDELLAETAEAIRATLDLPQWGNLRCLMGRYDGDSLMLLLPGCRLARSEQFAHVVRQRIAASYEDGCGVTVSIAVATFKGDDTIDDLLARSEKTMCLAKQFGGDCVEVSRTAELTRDLASVTRLPVAWQGRPKRSA
ncbi:MAG TPA: GGDEF domain-containing protein [Gammaproteobacteria bacterium]|nr:GGDEF domain-containing protein [Gammaproteobacteria bacterium]